MVTGSNMSGKSTLLRSIGVAAVLALAGGPVCASRAPAGRLLGADQHAHQGLARGGRVAISTPSSAGSSRWSPPSTDGEQVLFLLDEILHGTNSRERLIGARAVVLHLLKKGALGAVSSHDLGLVDLERESGGKVKNVHLEELVEGEEMTFDYKLKPGPVTTQNALRLMKLIGIAIEIPGLE